MRLAALIAGISFMCHVLSASEAQDLFNRVRGKVLTNIERAPRYTCVETIDREVRRITRRNACSPAGSDDGPGAAGPLLWRDRLRLDVAVIDGNENFAWAGARQFETEDVEKFAEDGAIGSGDFWSFLASIFGRDAEKFRYTGEQRTPAGLMARFEYDVPRSRTHYSYRTRGESKLAPYSGWFLVDPATAELRHLMVLATQFDPGDEVCRVEDTMDYHSAKIGDRDFLLPEIAVMDAVYTQGSEARNVTHYSACHEYAAQTSIHFDDASSASAETARLAAARQPAPAGIRVLVALDTPIDSDTSAAGDEIIAEALNDVKGSGANIVVHRGDRLYGRIVRLEQFLQQQPRWMVGIRFDSIERSGIESPIALRPLDDGVRMMSPEQFSGGSRRFRGDPLAGVSLSRPPGGGLFVFFEYGKLSLNSRFHSSWVTIPAQAR